MNQTIAYLPGLSPVESKELCARFDGGRLSSDGGVLLLRGIEKRLGLACPFYLIVRTDLKSVSPSSDGSSLALWSGTKN